MLQNSNTHVSKVFTNIINLIQIRKKQIAFNPNATQYTLNLGNEFFGVWRQSINRKQSIFAIYNITNKAKKLNINKINILNLENWIDLVSSNNIETKEKYLSFSPYQFMWITNKI